MSYKLTLQRTIQKRTNDNKIRAQIDALVARGLKGSRGRGWRFSQSYLPPRHTAGGWVFQCVLDFEKVNGQLGGDAEFNQWQQISAMIEQCGQGARYEGSPWQILEALEETANISRHVPVTPGRVIHRPTRPITGEHTEKTTTVTLEGNDSIPQIFDDLGELTGDLDVSVVKEVFDGRALDWEELAVPPELLTSTQAIQNHPCFSSIYDLYPQIRIALASIQRAVETNGGSRYHNVLWGHAGCGKTSVLEAIERMYPPGAVLHLDATSTTRAGIERLFFSKNEKNQFSEIPKLIFMEEAEKANEEALKIWLGALDDRGEIRKVNFRQANSREVKCLFFCTVNDKARFDRLMGSDGTEEGALSSRCVTEIYFPRPNDETLRKILLKEVTIYGGNEEWIDPCVQLARQLNITDPRKVKAFLAGGNRLLDGSYQADRLEISQQARDWRK